MQTVAMTVLFTDVYDGVEYPSTETIYVLPPPLTEAGDYDDDEALDDWATDAIYPLTGLGIDHEDAGYFAEITACEDYPGLVGREFAWGV